MLFLVVHVNVYHVHQIVACAGRRATLSKEKKRIRKIVLSSLLKENF